MACTRETLDSGMHGLHCGLRESLFLGLELLVLVVAAKPEEEGQENGGSTHHKESQPLHL